MDLFIEILAEIVMEWFFSGAEEVALGKKYPKPIRIFSAVIVLVLYFAVFALIAIAGIMGVKERFYIFGILLLAVDVLLIVLSVRKLIRLIRSKRK